MLIRTPDGTIDARAVQKQAEKDLRLDSVIVTDDIKLAVGLLATLIDELEAHQQRLEALRETMTYSDGSGS